MKRDKLIFLKNALKYFGLSTGFFFGGTILIKHFLFQEEIDHEVMTENLWTSLFVGLIFTIMFRKKWDIGDKEVNRNLPVDKR